MSMQDNLKAAFAGESQVNRMYLAFSHKRWGGKVGRLFQAVAEAEIIHAQNNLPGLQAVGRSLGHSKKANTGEYEFEVLNLDHTA